MAGYVTQDTLRLVVIGLVSVTAISVGAATIDTASVFGDVGGEEPFIDVGNSTVQDPTSNKSFNDTRGDTVDTGASMDLTWCAPFLPSMPGGIVYFGAFAGLLVFLKRRYSLGVAAFAMYGLSPIVLVAYFLSTSCATGGDESSGGGPFQDAINDAASTQLAQPDISPLWLIGILGLVLVATAAVIIRSSSDQELDPVDPDDIDDDFGTDVADLAAAAGAAADRLEKHNADVDNEVYRAWWEMTSLLDVPNPHSSTPGEFAAAAIEVGMGESYVDELTRLFEEVRYGKRDAESREDRAIEIFRAIEDEYGVDRDETDDKTETSTNTESDVGDEDGH